MIYRPDIEGMRGMAVLAVVAFHAFPTYMPGGFVGVDIFFVISGYLITNILLTGFADGKLRLADFYARRVVRLFPALILVMVTVLVIGWYSLLASEYAALGAFTVAGAAFFANVLAWHQSGYFDVAAGTKALLHLWSLGIEEQFYLAWPLGLLFFSRRYSVQRLLVLVAVLAGISFFLNFALVRQHPVAVFYSPVTRWFELMGGALLAVRALKLSREGIGAARSVVAISPESIALGGTLLVVASFVFISKNVVFPGAWVLLPVTGAMMLIAAGSNAWINRCVLGNRFVVWVGLISFPLFLWHWPLLSFATLIEGGTPSRLIRFLSVGLAFVLAWLTYRYVELPVRSYRKKSEAHCRRLVVTLCFGMLLIFLFGAYLQLRGGVPERVSVLAQFEASSDDGKKNNPPVGECDSKLRRSEAGVQCVKSALASTGTVIIIGDSHGEALASGFYLAQSQFMPSSSLVYFKTGGCLPLIAVETFNALGVKRNCSSHKEAFEYGLNEKSVTVVVLVGRWSARVGKMEGFGVFDGHFNGHVEILKDTTIELQRTIPYSNSEVFTLGLRKTLSALRAAGKRVVFVHQVPEFGFNPPFCGRRPIPLSQWSERGDRCSISREVVNARQQEYRDLFETVRRDYPEVKVIDPLPLFCDRDSCSMRHGDTYLYRDHNHLNPDGAYLVGRMIVDELR